MRRGARLVAMLAVAACGLAGAAASGGVMVLVRRDGTRTVFNIPDTMSSAARARVPQGSMERRSTLWPAVEETAKAHGVDPALVDLVIRMESGYNPFAVSAKGARGVMQLMPATASLYGVRNPFDARENIKGGVAYLRDLLARFGSNVGYALAAYNAGPEAVERHGGVPPYRETQSYVSSILGAYQGGALTPVLSGGFGRSRRTRPVTLDDSGGTALISNARRAGEAAVDRRLGLR